MFDLGRQVTAVLDVEELLNQGIDVYTTVNVQHLESLNDVTTHTPLTGAAVFGGVGMGPQEHAFRSGVDVMVATPGRLLDHFRQPYAKLDQLEFLVLDEPLSGMDPLARRRTMKLIREWARQGRSVLVSSHVLHEIEALTANILLINQGRILAEGDVHHIRDLIDEHPHTVAIKAARTRDLARATLALDHVLSLRFEGERVVVQTARPDAFYAWLTQVAATGECGDIVEVTSPDDNLQAVFEYLVK